MTQLEAEIDPKSTAVDLVTFDLTWLHLTVANCGMWLETTSNNNLKNIYAFTAGQSSNLV